MPESGRGTFLTREDDPGLHRRVSASIRAGLARPLRSLPYATPFASPEWLSGLPLEFVTVRSGSELIAAAGVGEMSISDYRDVLAVG